MSSDPRPRDAVSSRLVVGAIIALLGALMLGDNLGVFNAKHILHSLWPLALVAIGVSMVRGPDQRRRRPWGWVLVALGIWLFADHIGWIGISLWELMVPSVLLFVGGTLVWRAVSGPPQAGQDPQDHAEFIRSFVFMSSCELRPVSRPFRGADLNAVIGGLRLDLTNTRMESDTAVIDVFEFWGGVEILVPPDWSVTSQVTTLMGGFIDKRRPTSVVPTKTLILRGIVLMSGIEVKN